MARLRAADGVGAAGASPGTGGGAHGRWHLDIVWRRTAAKAALKDFQAAERAGAIDLVDAAGVVHAAEDKIRFEETADPSGERWAERGAIAGGVVGLRQPAREPAEDA